MYLDRIVLNTALPVSDGKLNILITELSNIHCNMYSTVQVALIFLCIGGTFLWITIKLHVVVKQITLSFF